jgi:hypothetical protein
VEQSGPLSITQAVAYARQTAEGLRHIHEQGLVHRDIKPSNLLLDAKERTGTERVKILDLGFALLGRTARAHSGSDLTRNGDLLGTTDYLAPEQALDPHASDHRADLYSLGCTLFFLLAGRAPFAGSTFAQTLARHQSETPAALHAVRPEVPERLSGIVSRLLAKRPKDRYQSAAEVIAALDNLDGGKAVVVGAPARGRRRFLWGAAGVLAAGSLGGLALWKGKRDGGDRTMPPDPVPGTEGSGVLALELDGVRQFVPLPDNLVRGRLVVTLEVWFRTGKSGVILGCQDLPWPTLPTYWEPALYLGTDGLLRGAIASKGVSIVVVTGQQTATDWRWHHAALVVDMAGRTDLYQDGKLVSQAKVVINSYGLGCNQLGAGRTVGWPAGSDSRSYFQGRLCEFRVWHAALDEARIRQSLHQTLTGGEPELAAWYAPDRAGADRLVDHSRYGRHVVLGTGTAKARPVVVRDYTFPRSE